MSPSTHKHRPGMVVMRSSTHRSLNSTARCCCFAARSRTARRAAHAPPLALPAASAAEGDGVKPGGTPSGSNHTARAAAGLEGLKLVTKLQLDKEELLRELEHKTAETDRLQVLVLRDAGGLALLHRMAQVLTCAAAGRLLACPAWVRRVQVVVDNLQLDLFGLEALQQQLDASVAELAKLRAQLAGRRDDGELGNGDAALSKVRWPVRADLASAAPGPWHGRFCYAAVLCACSCVLAQPGTRSASPAPQYGATPPPAGLTFAMRAPVVGGGGGASLAAPARQRTGAGSSSSGPNVAGAHAGAAEALRSCVTTCRT